MSERGGEGLIAGTTIVGAVAAVGFFVVAGRLGVAFAVPVGIAAVICAAIILRGPVGRALARRLEGITPDAASLDQVTAPLLGQMDEMRGRLAEVEERLDFTERVLTQQRDAERLPDR